VSVLVVGVESARPETLLVLPAPLGTLPVLRELPAFWPIYLWHHRRPWTRRLHQLGSWACIAGALGMVVSPWCLLIGIAIGYLFAFTGHWIVERNRPLTFGRPVLAGICNWVMFTLELGGRLDRHLAVVEEQARDDWDGYDVGGQ